MTRAWTLVFDDIPPSPNDRRGRHWRYAYGVAQRWHELVWAEVQRLGIPPLSHATLRGAVVLPRIGRRTGDADNDRQRFKEIQDGLVRVGVLADDDRGNVTWDGEVERVRGPRRGCRLTVIDNTVHNGVP